LKNLKKLNKPKKLIPLYKNKIKLLKKTNPKKRMLRLKPLKRFKKLNKKNHRKQKSRIIKINPSFQIIRKKSINKL